MRVVFSDEGDTTHCEIIHEGKSVKGKADKGAITGAVKLAIRKHGPRKVAHALGCEDGSSNYKKGAIARGEREEIPGIIFGIADAINTEAKCQALESAAASAGWSPFNVIKKVAWDYNPAAYVARKTAGLAFNTLKDAGKFAGRTIASPFRSKKGPSAPDGGPEGPEDSTPEQDAQDADASSGYELMQKWDIMGYFDIGCNNDSAGDEFVQGSDSDEPMAGSAGSTDNQFDIGEDPMQDDDGYNDDNILGWRPVSRRYRRYRPIGWRSHGEDSAVGDLEIGFAPLLAYQAYQHKKQLAKIAKSGNPRAANAAKSLHKAKSGDKREQAKIKAINARAKQGDPRAKDAIRRLKQVDALASRGARGPLGQLLHEGIT